MAIIELWGQTQRNNTPKRLDLSKLCTSRHELQQNRKRDREVKRKRVKLGERERAAASGKKKKKKELIESWPYNQNRWPRIKFEEIKRPLREERI